MGYYSQLSYEILGARVDPEKAKKLEDFFAAEGNGKIYGFHNVKLILTEENELFDIELEEYYAKFYDDGLFAENLSKVLTEGKVRLYFEGEDGESWGFEVTPGSAEELFVMYVTSEEYDEIRKRPRTVQKILKKLKEKDGKETLRKTTAEKAKKALFHLFFDLAKDLNLEIDPDALREEILG